MEAQYRTKDGRLFIKVEADTTKTLFKQVAAIQEVFEAETECGCCHSKDIQFKVRTVEENDFYELGCRACHARFAFGQHKKGGSLFPKRRDEADYLPNGGWFKYQSASASGPAAPVAPAADPAVIPTLPITSPAIRAPRRAS